MVHRLTLAFLLGLASLLLFTENSEACGRHGHSCYVPCWEPCPPCPPVPHYCYCLAYRDPYKHTGAMWVRCSCCPDYLPSWHWCYVYSLGRYDWVLVFRCYYPGTPFDKEAKDAEGFKEVSPEVASEATLVVQLPEDAKLTIDSERTTSTSSTRTFATPPLTPGKDYHYVLTAEVVRDGKSVAVTQTVTVRAGEETRVKMEIPTPVASK